MSHIYPSKIVMQLQIGRIARRLRHSADYTGQFGSGSGQQARKYIAQSCSVMQII
jgi:hypothetical protein